jgi:phage-related minor tail protein
MPRSTSDAATKSIRDAFYVTVGAGVMTIQQLEKVGRQLAERLSSQLGVGRDRVEQLMQTFEAQTRSVEDRVKILEARVDTMLQEFEERLPERAGEVLGKARLAAADARRQLRARVTRDAA